MLFKNYDIITTAVQMQQAFILCVSRVTVRNVAYICERDSVSVQTPFDAVYRSQKTEKKEFYQSLGIIHLLKL
uniref:Uncharacterized protein n=1 Tax=Anguilla anguilla TaxID=7936 RepID=A0A0E9WBU0_ANGAN